MNFKFLVAVVCLANIPLSVSGVAFKITPTVGTATIDKCQTSGANVSYAKPTGSGGTTPYTFQTTLTQVPTPTPALFAVDAMGNVTIKANSSTFGVSSYNLTLTMKDSTSTTALTAGFTLTVKVSDCSGVDVIFPSLTVICLCMISLLLNNK